MSDDYRKWQINLMKKVDLAMETIPDNLKLSAPKAWRWAKERLMRREGEGHEIQLVRDPIGIVCAFAKPQWPGDHCGSPMPTGALAIIRSVLEYEAGL